MNAALLNTIGVASKYVFMGGSWILLTYVGYIIKTNSEKAGDDKLRIMSCRRCLRKFDRQDEADKKNIF